MKQATFYLLDNAEPSGALSAHEAVACAVAAERWRAGKRVLIACESQEQAQRLDEALWQREPHEFVPHKPAGGAALRRAGGTVLARQARNAPRDLLIALLPQFADFATAFHEVVDFVPTKTL